LGDHEARPALQATLGRTHDPYTFVTVADALARLDDPRGRERLREALDSKETGVRMLAATCLAERGDAEAQAVLRQLMGAQSPSALVRVAAFGHLLRGGEGGAAATLRHLVRD